MRRLGLWMAVLLALAAAADSLAWRWAEGQIETDYAAWAAGLRLQGWSVANAPTHRSGFPFVARLDIPDLAIGVGDIVWRTEHATLAVGLTAPTTLLIGAAAPIRLHGAGLPEIAITADVLQASIPLTRSNSADIAADRLRATTPDGDLTVTRLRAHGEATAHGVGFGGTAGDIGLPEGGGLKWPLGARIASVAIDGNLVGTIPNIGTPRAQATSWRDGGGSLDVPHVALGWGPLGITGNLQGVLDANLQPVASGQMRILGYAATLDALVAGRLLTAREAVAARAVLGLLARQPEGGGEPEVQVPVQLRGGRVSVGGYPLARMPDMVWPGAR